MAASARPSPLPRRAVALKRADGEPLTRMDIQYDVLHAIFSDSHPVFSDPYGDTEGESKLTFRDLYIQAILRSPKATKALKDKMHESDTFSEDFAMLSLLVNVGRVNTTMSFFPEMKTTIRTYHPVPSLQRTNGNMQDAPRIKLILKTSVLEDEAKNPPATIPEVLAQCKMGQPPSTSVTNLIFVLSHHSAVVGQSHFAGRVDFLDLFLRTEFSSASRAQAFLWLCFNYLESPSSEDDYDEEPAPNPFSDPSKPTSPPSLELLSTEAILAENQESEEDAETLRKLSSQRSGIVETLSTKGAAKAHAKDKASVNGSVMGDDEEMAPPPPVEEPKAKGKRAVPTISLKGKAKRGPAPKEKKSAVVVEEKPREKEEAGMVVEGDDDDEMLDAFLKQRSLPMSERQQKLQERQERSLNLFKSLQAAPLPAQKKEHLNGSLRQHRYSPYELSRSLSPSRHARYSRNSQPRSVLQQAYKILSTDPLVDSDDEAQGESYTREDYTQRLKVINHLSCQPWAAQIPTFTNNPM